MNEDIYNKIFENYVQLLHKDIEELNIPGVINFWQMSQELGVRGRVLRKAIEIETRDMIKRLTNGRNYLQIVVNNASYIDLVKVWRLRKLANATLNGEEAKLRKLLVQKEYESIYWLLSHEFYQQIKSDDIFVLYVYFYVLSSLEYSINIESIVKDYILRNHQSKYEYLFPRLVKKINDKLRDEPTILPI